MQNRIKFGIRDTELAVAQSEQVLAPIRMAFPGVSLELVTMNAAGRSFLEPGDLEQALLEGWVDFAIQPLEQVPLELPDGLPLAACLRRSRQKYALVLAEHTKKLPKAKPIGCFTVLQQLQIRDQYPNHEVRVMEDSPEACLRLFHTGAIGGLVLDITQIEALDLMDRVYHWFTPGELVPPAAAGILVVQSRSDTDSSCLQVVNDPETACCARAERAFLRSAGGDPAKTGAYGRIEGGQMVLTGLLVRQDGTVAEGDIIGHPQQAPMLGEILAAHWS